RRLVLVAQRHVSGATLLSVVATLTLLAALMRLLLSVVGGTILVDFLPESVLSGFTFAAGMLIAVTQLDEALGWTVHGGTLSGQAQALWTAWQAGQRPSLWAALACVGTALLVGVERRYRPRVRLTLIWIGLVAWVAHAGQWNAERGVPLLGERSGLSLHWPALHWPSLDPVLWQSLMAPAAAIALISTLELAVCARAGGARPRMATEIQAQGWANLLSSFSGGMPASASLSRSSLLRAEPRPSRMTAALAALLVLPILWSGGALLAAVPQSVLAGLLIGAAFAMVDIGRIRRMWQASPVARSLFCVTLVSALTLPLAWAVLIGVALGTLICLVQVSRPRLQLLVPTRVGLRPPAMQKDDDLWVVEVSGNLYFAAANRFYDEVTALLTGRACRGVIVDLSHAHAARYAAMVVLERLRYDVQRRGGEVVLAGVSPGFATLLRRAKCRLQAYAHNPVPGASVVQAIRHFNHWQEQEASQMRRKPTASALHQAAYRQPAERGESGASSSRSA
ncbi:MAG: SulP family inorganic anion transporter, partial [Polyangiales bacterium]